MSETQLWAEALDYRRRYTGVIGIASKVPIKDRSVLSIVYTPGVAEPPSLPVGPAGELSPAVRTRVLRLWAAAVGAAPLAAEHVRALDALVTGWRGQGPVPLPGGVEASRTSGGPESSGRLEAHPTSRRSEVEG